MRDGLISFAAVTAQCACSSYRSSRGWWSTACERSTSQHEVAVFLLLFQSFITVVSLRYISKTQPTDCTASLPKKPDVSVRIIRGMFKMSGNVTSLVPNACLALPHEDSLCVLSSCPESPENFWLSCNWHNACRYQCVLELA